MTVDRTRHISLFAGLEQAFDQVRAEGKTTWAILDPASYRVRSALAKLDRSRGTSLFEGTPLSRDESVAPRLLPLPAALDPNHDRLIDIALEYPAVVWLASGLPAEELAAMLREKLRAVLADRQAITLRYYDPRVLPELVRVFNAEQQRRFGDGIDRWWWLDRQNALQSWRYVPGNLDAPQAAPTDAEMMLTDAQVSALLDASFVDRVLDQIDRGSSRLPTSFDRRQRFELVTQLIERANSFGLASEFDCANFIIVALKHGHDFDARDDWAPLMAKLKAKHLSFSDVIEQWEDGHA